jgi:hypothetical protein
MGTMSLNKTLYAVPSRKQRHVLYMKRLATGWTAEGSEFESRKGQGCFPLHSVQTGSGAYTA